MVRAKGVPVIVAAMADHHEVVKHKAPVVEE